MRRISDTRGGGDGSKLFEKQLHALCTAPSEKGNLVRVNGKEQVSRLGPYIEHVIHFRKILTPSPLVKAHFKITMEGYVDML